MTPIAKPPWTGLGKKLESMLRRAVYDYALLHNTTSVAIALSGGKDSLSLLYLLKAISGKGFAPLTIHAIHISGTYSCGASVNINYLKNICDELEVGFSTIEQQQDPTSLNCYSCSRRRRSLLFEEAKRLGINTIAFGHHRDDSIQTLLLNLLHKAEFSCNLPKIYLQKYDITLIRPLILIPEQDIITFAKQNGFARIMCQCPIGQNSMRKQVDKLLTSIETHFPNARGNLAQAGRIYGSDKAKNP